VLNIFFKIFSSIPPKKKLYVFYLIIFATFSSFTEIISVASLLPMLEIMFNTNDYLDSFWIKKLSNFVDISDVENLKQKIVIIFILLVFLSFVVKIMLILATNYISMNLGHIIMTKVFKKTLHQNYEYFIKSHTSKFLSNIDRSSNTQAFLEHFLQIVVALILFISILIFTISLDFKILLNIFIFVGIAYFLVFILLKKINEKIGKIYNYEIENRLKIIHETFGNIKEIIIGKFHNYFFNQFVNSNLRYIKAVLKNTLVANIPGNFIVFISIVTLAYLIFDFSSNNTLTNQIPLFGTIIFALQKILNHSQSIYSNFVKIKFTKNSAIDIIKILELKINDNNNKNDIEKYKIKFNNKISIKDGFFKYQNQKKDTIEDINLDIEKNSIILIEGESGSGKTTLLNIFTGLVELKKGNFLVDDQIINSNNVGSWYDKINYLSQNTHLLDSTIKENIIFGELSKDIDDDRFNEALDISGLNQLIKSSDDGVNTNIGEQGKKISGGQKQRIILARAIYSNKQVLFFDEATNALDEKSENLIYDKIINNIKNKTIIVVSHRKSLRSRFKNIYEIKNGKIRKIS